MPLATFGPDHHGYLDAPLILAGLKRKSNLLTCCIPQGPPGTGKTTTIARLLIMLANCGQRVLATAPTNVAIAEVAQRCAAVALWLALLLSVTIVVKPLAILLDDVRIVSSTSIVAESGHVKWVGMQRVEPGCAEAGDAVRSVR